MGKVLPALLVLLWLPTVAQAAEDFLIVPGKRAGVVTANSTEDSLLNTVPENAVKRSLIYAGEGRWRCGTILYPETASQIEIIWESDDRDYEDGEIARCEQQARLHTPSYIQILVPEEMNAAGSPWHTEEGLRLSSPLREIERLNKGPIDINVCECCAGGGIYTREGAIPESIWLNGGFDAIEQETLDRYAQDQMVRSDTLPEPVRKAFRLRKMMMFFEKTS